MSQFLSNGQGGQKSRVSLIIGGKDFEGSRIFPVKNPSGEVVWEATGASVEDAIKAVEAAEAALPAWAATKPAARRDIFLRAAEIFSQRYKEFVSYQVDETGADPSFIDWILPLTIDNLKEAAGKCSLVQETIPACSEDGRSALVLREPYGVILGIAPWYVK
jgi:acyl-CoA reductase-like NAD-dependent aldehyde dehydrogenase